MKYQISGGNSLQGTLFVQGAKNAILPMISGALLVKKGQTVLRNVPFLEDVKISIEIARSVGAKVEHYIKEEILVIDASSVNIFSLNPELTSQSRASILFLPSILYRMNKVEFGGVGGCSLGVRRLDFHHNGFKRLGAKVEGEHDQLMITADQLHGNLVYLDIPSQTSTENLMMAACLAKGITIIENAGAEPEIIDFANFLNKMGAKIVGAGTGTIIIEGVLELNPVEYFVMPDRLDAGAFMMAAAITNGDIQFIGAEMNYMRLLKVKLEQMGVDIKEDGHIVRVKGTRNLKPINVVTWPYPGFSTDFHPGLMAVSTIASGESYFRENVFEDRFTQIEGLNILGADIEKKSGTRAIVRGKNKLKGGSLTAPDLRAGMAFIIAGLSIEGETTIDNVYQIGRGHSYVDIRLQNLGAQIKII